VGVGITDNKDKSFELIFTVPVGREGVAGWGGRVAEWVGKTKTGRRQNKEKPRRREWVGGLGFLVERVFFC
jgi:hypothetical protein